MLLCISAQGPITVQPSPTPTNPSTNPSIMAMFLSVLTYIPRTIYQFFTRSSQDATKACSTPPSHVTIHVEDNAEHSQECSDKGSPIHEDRDYPDDQSEEQSTCGLCKLLLGPAIGDSLDKEDQKDAWRRANVVTYDLRRNIARQILDRTRSRRKEENENAVVSDLGIVESEVWERNDAQGGMKE